MDLKKLLDMQGKLDELIFKNAGITEYPVQKVVLALLTELGELSNEVKSFKYWKKVKGIDRNKVLEEFADCLHFALSIENRLQQCSNLNEDMLTKTQLDLKNENLDTDKVFIAAFNSISECSSFLPAVILLGMQLDVTFEEMEAAYLKKHEENYKRQENGY